MPCRHAGGGVCGVSVTSRHVIRCTLAQLQACGHVCCIAVNIAAAASATDLALYVTTRYKTPTHKQSQEHIPGLLTCPSIDPQSSSPSCGCRPYPGKRESTASRPCPSQVRFHHRCSGAPCNARCAAAPSWL